jgi:hypothetical protein
LIEDKKSLSEKCDATSLELKELERKYQVNRVTRVFEKNAILFAESCQKSQKIVIIKSPPDWAIFADWVTVYFGYFL